MPDPIERLVALSRANERPCSVERAAIARRAAVRRVRAGALTGSSALACGVAVAVLVSGPAATRSIDVTTTPTAATTSATPTAAPTADAAEDATPGPASGAESSSAEPDVQVPVPGGDSVDVYVGPPPSASYSPSPRPTFSPPAPANPPSPVFWQGSYGAVPFYGRQTVRDAKTCVKSTDGDAVSDVVFSSGYCERMEVRTSTVPGGEFLTETAICAFGDKSHSESFSGPENALYVYDYTTEQDVVRWTEPAGWTRAPYTLDDGDCVHYLWRLNMVADDGTAFVSGRKYLVRIDHQGGDFATFDFTAP